MFKRKDNDIFGTDSQKPAPRIQNDSYIDPHAAFKRKTEQNYSRYASKLTSTPQSITLQPLDSSNVNEQAAFGDTYQRNRKEADMQSSIFYEPTQKLTLRQQHEGTSLAVSRTES